jgi:hypothetical protein
MRQTVWKQKVEKQAVQALFTAKFLLRNKPEDPAIEKLLTRMRDTEKTGNSSTEENKTENPGN